MADFIAFARRMLQDRAMLVAALVFATLSAFGLGAGLLSLIPAIELIVDPAGAGSLQAIGAEFNAAGNVVLGIPVRAPTWLLEMLPDGRLAGVVTIVVFITILTVLGATCNFMHQYLSITVAARTIANARMALFRTAMFMPLVRVANRGASEFVARIIRDSSAVQRALIALMSKAVAHATQAIVLFAVALVTGGSLTIIAVVILPLLAIIIRKIGKRIRRATRGALQKQEELLRVSTECVQGLRTVKTSTGEGQVIAAFDEINREVVRQELRARLARAASGPIMETIAVLAVGALVIFAARAIISAGTLTVERFVIALGSLAFAGSKVKTLAGVVNELQAASAPAARVLEIIDEALEDDDDARPALPRHRLAIRIENARVTYPGAVDPALDGVDLEIPHGQRVAVVGPNGSGKTTLVSLIPRLITPDTGRVLVDGTDVATVSLQSLRTQIGVVTQETVLFRGSVADNIRFGTAGALRDAVEDAGRRAHADAFIRELPSGYEANVTEQGASLSGGQRQRLVIARAILRDPAILILDEATSQIDAESETDIAAAITEFGDGRTVIIIAHRLATVLDADRIIVMDRGKIVGDGTHDSLLAECALYQRLSKNQLVAAG